MVSNASDSRCTNASAEPNARAVVPLGIKWATSACERKAKCISGCNECSEATLSHQYLLATADKQRLRAATGLWTLCLLRFVVADTCVSW